MEFVRSEHISLNTRIKYLKFNPSAYSFIASLGLGFFFEILKDLNSYTSQNYLQNLYKELSGIPEILITSKLGQFYEFFMNFCQNIKDYQNFGEIIQNSTNQSLVYTIFYVFSALYSKVMNCELFISQPSDIDLFKIQIEYFLNQLKLKVTLYKNNEAFLSIGSGLNISLLQLSDNDFSLLLSNESTVQNDQCKLIEELFRQISIPKSIEKFNKIIELINEFSTTYKKTTPEMETIKSIRRQWTCNHDLTTLKASCGQKHCLNCLFNMIKTESPETSRCPCGRVLNHVEIEKVFNNTEPAFDRFFLCGRCHKKFKSSSSLHCSNHKTCLNCRLTDVNKCVDCLRQYRHGEINEKIKELKIGNDFIDFNYDKYNPGFIQESEKKSKDFKCVLCKRMRKRTEVSCVNSCEVCRVCFSNCSKCPQCTQCTNVQMVYTCVVCRAVDKKVNKILACLHPVHENCAGNHRC
jgi:hypothetical protein